jgi:hypothetical protein
VIAGRGLHHRQATIASPKVIHSHQRIRSPLRTAAPWEGIASQSGDDCESEDDSFSSGLDIYGASNSIRDLVRKRLVRSTRRGSRVYELVQPRDLAEQELPEDLTRVVEFLGDGQSLSNEDVQRVLGVSRATATRYLREWTGLGLLVPTGKGAGRRYSLAA